LTGFGQLHHIGIVVREFEPARSNILGLLQGSVIDQGTDERLAAQWVWIDSRRNPIVELVAPAGDGPIAAWLERRGEGLHHLSFMPESLDGSMSHARDCGLQLMGEDRDHGGFEEFFIAPGETGHALFHSFRAFGE
jgi:methylmalonyl-CoA/ethylmalonyl-CoA epimerase